VKPISFKRHRFPSAVILQAVRLYFRFTLSIRDVEELMAERGVEVSREAIRCFPTKCLCLHLHYAQHAHRRRSQASTIAVPTADAKQQFRS
jgi:transposase-like protein